MTQPAGQPNQQAAALVTAQQTALFNLRAQVLSFLVALWAKPGSWRDADLAAFLKSALPVVNAGQRQTAAFTAAYLQQLGRLNGSAPLPMPSLAALTGAPLRNGAEPAQVYSRPFQTVWTSLSQGDAIDTAVAKGEQRLQTIAATDLQLAKTHTAQRMLTDAPGVVGYERVLEGTHSCGLCVIASTQRYHRGDLMPIHDRCDCSVQPIFGDQDPGRVIHPQRLLDAQAQIALRIGQPANTAAGLKRQVIVHQHGEIGPVLTVRAQHFTGPAQIPAQ
jgi:hypothetical protein